MSPNSQRYMYNRSQESTLADNFFGLGEQQSSRQQQKSPSPLRYMSSTTADNNNNYKDQQAAVTDNVNNFIFPN